MNSLQPDIQRQVFGLIEIVRDGNSDVSKELHELWKFCLVDEHKLPFCDPSLGLLPALAGILKNCKDNERTIDYAVGCVLSLSINDDARPIIASSALFRVLMQVIDLNLKIREKVLKTFSNCSLNPATHPVLLSFEVGFLKYLSHHIARDAEDGRLYKSFSDLLSSNLNDNYVDEVIQQSKIHEIAWNCLFEHGSNPCNWIDRWSNASCVYWSLNIILDLSSFVRGAAAIKAMDANRLKQYFIEMLQYDTAEGIKATFILANLHGTEEELLKTPFLQEFPNILPSIVDIFRATLDWDPENSKAVKDLVQKGLAPGIILLKHISSALRNLSNDQSCKVIIAENKILLNYIAVAIQSFISNNPPFIGYIQNVRAPHLLGGGGKDTVSIENFLALLLLLSSSRKDGEETFPPSVKILEMIKEILILPTKRPIPETVRELALSLYKKLCPRVEWSIQRRSRNNDHNDRLFDVFLSHDWGENGENHLKVRKINFALSAKGLKTWFDEEKIHTDLRPQIAEGIENSRFILIFITDNYRRKVNECDGRDFCHYEFRYAHELHGPLKMIPVVMESKMRDQREWKGELGAGLAGSLLRDLSNVSTDDYTSDEFNAFIEGIYTHCKR